MGHTKVAQAPSHHGADGQQTIVRSFAKEGLSSLNDLLIVGIQNRTGQTEEFHKSGDLLGIVQNRTDAACCGGTGDEDQETV